MAESFSIDATAMGLAEAYPWSVKKHRLRGGRRDGVDLIVVDNGALRFSIVPTRGMGLWKGWYDGNRLGWDSPVTDGPVHPSLVNLAAAGGLGWLDGFDELLARCGLENNGAPFEVKTMKPDGSESNTTFGLHGKIANIPASYVAVHVGTEPPHEIVVEGHVEESRLFGPRFGWSPNHDGPRLEHAGRSRRIRQPQGTAGGDPDPLPLELRSAVSWPGSRFVAPINRSLRATRGRRRGLAGTTFTGPRAWLDRAGLLLRAACRTAGDPDAGHAPQPSGIRAWSCDFTKPASRVYTLEKHRRSA